jgi:6-pyruvoyltetrahydropterin/6-carboxytetrahydropterin synthase
MATTFQVRVTGTVFCSAHFITFAGGKCEPLHGHNYRASAEVTAALDANHYVFDFITLRRLMTEICSELDHRLLLPGRSPLIQVKTRSESVEVRFGERSWSFPAGDCIILPLENTTAELLARYIAGRLSDRLKQECSFTPKALQVEVEESPGQSALYRESS